MSCPSLDIIQVFEIMAFTNNEEAVSPVIGVILMVAITVILAAVIAAFVFGMAGNISKTKVVAVTAQKPDSGHISVTYQGGQDAASVSAINVSVDGATSVNPYLTTATNGWMNSGTGSLKVGCNTIALGTFTAKTHVVATGTFTDGTQQVLLDTYL